MTPCLVKQVKLNKIKIKYNEIKFHIYTQVQIGKQDV